MFKKFLIISLFIPIYSFSSDSLRALIEREQRLSTVNACYSDRNTHCVLGVCSGGVGRLLFAALNNCRVGIIPSARPKAALFCFASVCCSGYNLAKGVAMQCRIDRDSRALSQTQADLHRQIVSAMSSLPLSERQSSNDISR